LNAVVDDIISLLVSEEVTVEFVRFWR